MTSPITTLAYRSVLPVPHCTARHVGGDLLDVVRGAFGKWLAEKYRRRVPLGSGQHRIDGVSLLTSHAAYAADGSECAMRLELRQDTDEATWRTTVTAVCPLEHPGAVKVDLECFPNSPGPLRAGKPRLVQELVRELEPHDGVSRLSVQGLRVTADNVPKLVDVLCDPDRTLPVIVASRPRHPDPLWSERVAATMPRAAGDASLYVLWDTDAADALREAVGEHHRVTPGAVRTYLPEVDPAWEPDAARHRWLALARWADPGDRAWHGVARTVQRMALDRPQPVALRTVSFPDLAQQGRQERQESMEKARAMTMTSAPQASETEDALRSEIAVLNELLEVASVQLDEAGRSVGLAERANASLAEQLQAAAAVLDAEMEDHLLTLSGLEQARAEADALRSMLLRQGRWEEVAAATEVVPAIPVSFEELWDRVDAFPHLCVTADRRIALGLDEHAEARTWAAKAWSGLTALNSYAEHIKQEGYAGGFHQFCKNPPAGARVYPVSQVAMTEAAATMAAYGHERMFPAADGRKVEMQAHLKLAARGTVCPRVHFLDDLAGKGASGLVSVGYVGPHLTNKRTN
ncbi:hypothetical protein [Streptomyces javensis]|uniref:Uncharacterized protein n=1 Tax=Streptomyces javensis TaxID=114698 RepID=A0ABS0RCG8_9ACTN|nr:hypothetical protein [Streptomyces javensis]MBI0314755.1 hypothetical protein [Streptomyces javensis]